MVIMPGHQTFVYQVKQSTLNVQLDHQTFVGLAETQISKNSPSSTHSTQSKALIGILTLS